MRTIKFRGIKSGGYDWCIGYLYRPLDRALILPYNSLTIIPEKMIEVEKETVGQYTGLLDKNGKEIYEGDIVEFKANGIYQKGIIEWCNNCCFGFRLQWINFGNNERISNYKLKVIGNIYEHSHLVDNK